MRRPGRNASAATVAAIALVCAALGLCSWACRRSRVRPIRVERQGAEYRLVYEGKPIGLFAAPELAASGLPRIEVGEADEAGWRRVRLSWDVSRAVAQDELSVRFDVGFDPDFWWAPHLAPEQGYVVAQHVFRAPAVIAARGPLTLAVVPDLDIAGKNSANPWFLDYDAVNRKMWLGLVKTEIPEHVLFRKAPGMTFAPGRVERGLYIGAFSDRGEVRDPWR
ncbi:MAG: hypothetical protein ACXW2Z_06080 [Candidatus Aminicenantales bacterium]